MDAPFVRDPYNYDAHAVSRETGLSCEGDPGVTHQSFAEECDINTIVRRFGLSGELPEAVRMPTYADFTHVSDFHSAMNAIAAAKESFETLPAEVRARFNNDPGAFVDFCSDERNRPEAEKLGMVAPRPVVVPADPPKEQ